MSKEEITIHRLEKQRVAVALGFGPNPEELAWEMLVKWAKPFGYLDQSEDRKIYGFNNPNPSPGSPNYGYQFCMTIKPGEEGSGDIKIEELTGGLYAVIPFDDPERNYGVTIPDAWKKLDAWVAVNNHQHGKQQWLEEHTLDGDVVALFYPITG